MSIGIAGRKGRSPGKRQSSTVARMPAPHKGVDDRIPFAAGAPEVCVYSFNLVPSDGGIGLRKGFREYQIEVDNGAGISVNTILPFAGVAADGSEDRLFVVTNEGIWDVTTAEGTPILKEAFSDQSADAGYGVFTAYVTDAGAKVMLYADSLNGLFTYDVATDAWAQASGITGPTITDINFIAIHKARIWLVEKDATKAWYLDPGAISGPAVEFFFGSKFKEGGALRGLFSWTVDGGRGVSDLFVAVSSAGDVVVYEGTDPSSADTWSITGVYFIGNLPKGPKFGTEQGGELYLLSTYGVIGMTDLLNGVAVASAQQSNASARIAGLLRERLARESNLNGWAIRNIPPEGGILISAPVETSTRSIQYFYNVTVNGWGFWRDLDIYSFNTWQNAVVFGDGGLRVLLMDQERDEVRITPESEAPFNGQPIDFATLTSFSSLDAPSVYKRVKYIRPDIIGVAQPNFAAAARYDYILSEPGIPLAVLNAQAPGAWDVADWDQAVWGVDVIQGFDSVYGGWGIGRSVAVAYRGESYYSFTLVGWDIIYDAGGPML